ncbi:homing endonuclease associated repeat-containing protein [uncultured Hymenobacter sp.]|uniref:homing endonuclease associated repeat-containing protein n=1 Tax=uncultured Hymenobacter sp. TaxID=170016 RepID=UPI0035CA68F6
MATHEEVVAAYNRGTIGARFGSWNNALAKAGLQCVQQRGASKKDLFKNLEEVWISIGRWSNRG